MGYREEEVFDNLKEGIIDEYEAKRELERINGSCGCMDRPIRNIIQDVQDGFKDSWDASRDFERQKSQCDYQDRLRQEEREAEERERMNGW